MHAVIMLTAYIISITCLKEITSEYTYINTKQTLQNLLVKVYIGLYLSLIHI